MRWLLTMLPLLSVVLPLSGRGVVAARQEVEAKAAALAAAHNASSSCTAKYPPDSKMYVEKIACYNQAYAGVRRYAPYPDLFDQQMASRMVIAERLQAGKLTLTEANLQFAQEASRIVAEEQRRSLGSRAANAQEAVAMSAMSPVSCARYGATTTCF